MTINKSMILTTGQWNNQKTFKLMPVTRECPFIEGIYDPSVKVLALISDTKKQVFHMVPKIDPNGDPEKRKAPGQDGNPYKQERRSLESFQEYYIEERSEIEEMIKLFAINADSYDYKGFLDAEPTEANTTI
jgi:hypothetical protein